MYTLAVSMICKKRAEDGSMIYILSEGKYNTFNMLTYFPLHPLTPRIPSTTGLKVYIVCDLYTVTWHHYSENDVLKPNMYFLYVDKLMLSVSLPV